MSETTQAVIEAVTSKEGATNGRPWKKFSVKTQDGTFYSTFDAAVAQAAHGLVGKTASITWKASGDTGQFRDILAAASVNGVDPAEIPTEKDANGNADWDLIGLRKTRCLLWAEFLSSPIALEAFAGEGPHSGSDRVFQVGSRLVAMAESDIYHRAPATADEALPF